MPCDDAAPGLLVMISGPSGVGKTTILHRVLGELDAVFSVSATTRAKTARENEGVDYRFIDETAFQSMIDRGEFLEFAQVFGRNWYGTPAAWHPKFPTKRSLHSARRMP